MPNLIHRNFNGILIQEISEVVRKLMGDCFGIPMNKGTWLIGKKTWETSYVFTCNHLRLSAAKLMLKAYFCKGRTSHA